MGAEQIMETFWLLATFMNHDGAWITARQERGEDTQITTSCSGSRSPLSREKRHDYFKHSLPSGLWERKETLSSSCWMSLIFSSPRQIFKTHKIIPVDSWRVFTRDTGSHVVTVWALTSPYPGTEVTPAYPGQWPPVLSPAAQVMR